MNALYSSHSINNTPNTIAQLSASELTNIHQRYQLEVSHNSAPLSILQFSAEEALSTPYRYTIELTSSVIDIPPDTMLNRDATFSFFAPIDQDLVSFKKLTEPESLAELLNTPLRKVYGIVTDFARLSTSKDENRYRVVLQPHLALLDNQRKYAIYQDKTVNQVIEAVLREHHFHGAYFLQQTIKTYPTRSFFCQWNESDLQFIQRLCAEVGIWYRFEMDAKLNREVIIFGDDSSKLVPGLTLPHVHPSNLNDNKTESVWQISAIHKVVEGSVTTKDYNYGDPKNPLLNTETVRTAIDTNERHLSSSEEDITYGNAYHYQDDFLTEGEGFEPAPESGKFYAMLRHERYLNGQIRIRGMSTSQSLKPGDILTIQGELDQLPKAIESGVIIVSVKVDLVKRDGSYVLSFEGIPYRERVGFRPDLLPKPIIAGTIPATVVHHYENETYAWLDEHGRYHVKFNFDLNGSWKKGYSSLPVRLAKPYAGDTYGWHYPLLANTEVQIAFVEGDPDRPYIAHVMHNHSTPDLVNRDNHTRNVIRTPANNKLRMEDLRGEEHVKLNTEYGKTQLNLGHLVDNERKQRGVGFELRTDKWGAIRAGKGLFITADEQSKAQGQVLNMQEAINQLETALSIAKSLANASEIANTYPADTQTQHTLKDTLNQLSQSGILTSAPQGIGVVSSKTVQLSSGEENIALTSGKNTEISAVKRFTAAAGEAISLFAQKMGINIFANKGKVSIQAQNDELEMTSLKDMKLTSVNGIMTLSADKELILNCQGAYIKLSGGNVEIGCPKNILNKSRSLQIMGPSDYRMPPPNLPSGYSEFFILKNPKTGKVIANCSYRITTSEGEVYTGISDKEGKTVEIYTAKPSELKIEFT